MKAHLIRFVREEWVPALDGIKGFGEEDQVGEIIIVPSEEGSPQGHMSRIVDISSICAINYGREIESAKGFLRCTSR